MCQYEVSPVTRVPASVDAKVDEFRHLLSPGEEDVPIVLPQYDLVTGRTPQNR